MANPQQSEQEKQFQADIEKATALSLESSALEEFRRKKRSSISTISTPHNSKLNQESHTDVGYKSLEEYRNFLKQRTLSLNESNAPKPTTAAPSIAPPPAVPTRRNSVQNNREEPLDLISFNPFATSQPTKPVTEQESHHANFVQLVDNMHKLNSQLQDNRSVSLPARSNSLAPAYGFHTAFVPQTNPMAMQLVPYAPADKPIPLTPEQLNKLYNMNTTNFPMHPSSAAPIPNYSYQNTIPTTYTPGLNNMQPPQQMYMQNPNVPPNNVQVNFAPTFQPQQPVHQQANQYYTTALAPVGYGTVGASNSSYQSPHTQSFMPNQQQLSNNSNNLQPLPPYNRDMSPSPNTTPKPFDLSSLVMPKSLSCSLISSSKSDVTFRKKIDRKTGSNDLIDLDNDDRVSVLEAFDPLLNGNRSSSEEDKEDNASSYYSEYDPFDYIYSGGTQYSDPVYDAVNRSTICDKQLLFPDNGPPIGFNFPSESEVMVVGRQAPPLPPRNYSSSSAYSFCVEAQRDRKKVLTKLYEDVVVKKTYDVELVAFYEMVKELRGKYIYSDTTTNIGHVVAAELESQYPEGSSIKLLVHPVIECINVYSSAAQENQQGSIDGYGSPVAFTCDITTTVEHALMQAFCKLEDQIMGNVSDYMLKTIGVQEFLSPKTRLNQLEFIHNSIKLEKDVQLGLCPRSDKYLKIIARTARDDYRDSEIKLEDILPKEPVSTISYDNLMILLETLETEIDRLESSADIVNSHVVLSCSGVVQGVKAICALLGSIDTLEVTAAIEELRHVCANGQSVYRDSSSQYSGSKLDIVSEAGDYAEVKLRPKTMNEQLKSKCNMVRCAIRHLLEIYAQAFRVNFCVDRPDWTTKPLSIVNIAQRVMVHILCLHRPPPTWKHDDYLLGAQIYHGTRYISEAVVTRCSNELSGLYPRFKFNSWIHFENIQLCTLPREARLIFVLYGCTTVVDAGNEPSNQASSSTATQEGRVTQVELGWSSIQFFDYERMMLQGSYLLSLWPPTNDKYFGIAPAKGTHPYGHSAPVLGIEIPDYGGSLMFPEPMQNVPDAPRLDFYSLDSNLQQELIDTAEQGYPLDKLDKREVLWEKRYYLQNFPNALPKVLHAAHSWDYACLADLHALLKSWTPLPPLQALELLLPRYPDLEVRTHAVKWISQMPNDQLVDFLPQLLQALKHDTYETSSLAQFLLSRALESPRVAHYLYWLLVHSIPGDAPQNNIELSHTIAFDESLMCQARYHRRSQLMLRSLLAICGEKLTARFLAQNMICKALSDTAQAVKNVKESLRIQTLRQGLETVHQILLEHPTTLPLGPGLEVCGVQTRSSSYFNSNTLPLKINFLGPDKSILPAIFKAGDDLQQDMLTIQMVRIMDKLWLREGLDLKIVTFDCIPTGDKKGMIELVSDAETLRKIQVEWGLTGSFKDKPIAEWLARQNPSQLEYQRAVDNFTVSCAGYSVATYILGICDRHNDNIMLKTSGHLFHIDFGKFLGDAQMFGNFKRDRTPFVLTSDMAYVINGGDRPSSKFHHFVDLCCQAFNIVRKNGDLLLHMFALMATSGIPGVTAEAVTYVRAALLPGQSNPEAAASFAKMIHISLKSWFTQFNFFLHNLAQMRFTNENGDGELLSFVPRIYNMREDGRLKSVTVHGAQKRYAVEKYYTFILKVTRQAQPDPAYLFRSYKEFCEFHQKMCLHFPLARLHGLPTGLHVGRSNIKTVADKRLPEIQKFLVSLFSSADEIAHSDLVYTFFHPLLRDQQEADIHVPKVKETRQITIPSVTDQLCGELKLSLQYHRGALTVMVHHAKALPQTTSGQEPNTYVKVYLKPDRQKATKRKTKVVRKNCYPSFMETLEYRLPLEFIQTKILEITVWSHDSLQENEFLGGVQLHLVNYDLRQELIKWFPLAHLPRV